MLNFVVHPALLYNVDALNFTHREVNAVFLFSIYFNKVNVNVI